MANVIRPLYYKLVEALKCPLCEKRLENVEAVCLNGHGICEDCSTKTTCICGNGYSVRQHTLLKTIIETLLHPYTFFEALPMLFECPVCYDQVENPIRVCFNGHAICHRCYYRTAKCPTCRGFFSKRFNSDLNKIIKIIRKPVHCYNSTNGCKYTDIYYRLALHENICPFNQFSCLFDSCSWYGTCKAIRDHVLSQHSHIILQENAKLIMLSAIWKNTVYLIVRHGQMFWFKYEYDTKGVYLGLQILEYNEANKYRGQLEFQNRNEITSMTFRIIGLENNLESIIKHRKCLFIPRDVIDKFKTKKGLMCQLNIHKRDSKLKTYHILYPALIAATIFFCQKIIK